MSRSGVAAVAIVGAMLVLAPGCGRGRATGPPPGGTLTIARRDSFATFDPPFAWTPDQSPYLDLVFEGLVALDGAGPFRPGAPASPGRAAFGEPRTRARPGRAQGAAARRARAGRHHARSHARVARRLAPRKARPATLRDPGAGAGGGAARRR